MNIQEASKRSGLPTKTIRYYDEIDLVSPARADNGYRDYDEPAVQKLAFLKRARYLGFSLKDCRQLLSLWEDNARASSDVKAIAESRLAAIDERLAELHHLRDTLAQLIDACHGDQRPDCPILADIGTDPPA